MKIIHIGPDSQFVQFLSTIFEEFAPGANHYFVTGASAAGDFRYPVCGGGKTVSIQGKRGLASVPLYVRCCDMVIAHSMGPHAAAAFMASPRSAVRVWSGWGFDYYGDDTDSSADLIKPDTMAIMRDEKLKIQNPPPMRKLARKIISSGIHSAARRTDYFSAPIPSDFDIFKRRFQGFQGKYAQLNYGDVASTFAKGVALNNEKNILLGNSASETNNHLEIFKILSMHDLKNRKVIVPLSYGNPDYRSKVIAVGRKMLGEAFLPLVHFMPLNEYSSIIASCNVVIMNHLRQQALGNIGAALYQGAHVYLDPSNPTYKFFAEKKAAVHSIDKLSSESLPLTSLCADDILKNRSMLESFWGQEQVRANVQALLTKVHSR